MRGRTAIWAFRGLEMQTSDNEEIPLNSVDHHVGRRLKARRLLLQMSEEWLAGRLNVSASDIENFEFGTARISFAHLNIAADALNVPERYFYLEFGPADGGKASKSDGWLREVDCWFRDNVAPHEGLFLKMAMQFTRNIDAARDVVHDAYALVITGERWKTLDNPRAYIRKAVANLCLVQLRRNKIVRFDDYAEIDEAHFADAAPDAFQTMVAKERLASVARAIDKLPKQCRRVFIMRKIEGITPAEIAAHMGISIKTVQSHLARGLVELNKHLENNEKKMDLKIWVAERRLKDQERT